MKGSLDAFVFRLTVDLESGESERQIEKDEVGGKRSLCLGFYMIFLLQEYARALEERSREEAEKERREHLLALQRQDEVGLPFDLPRLYPPSNQRLLSPN